MTFEAMEISIENGQPIELFEFARQNLAWRFNSGYDDIEVDSKTWNAGPIKRTQLEANNAQERTTIKVTVSRSNEVADLFRVAPPSDVISLTVYRTHFGDLEPRVVWMGKVLNCEWKAAEAILTCEPAAVSLNRIGLRRLYQRSCPHKLYGTACGVVREDYETAGTVSSISGGTVNVSAADALADGYFSGGMIEWDTPDNVTEKRMIRKHVGAVLTLTHAITALSVGDSVRIYPGCSHTTSVCNSRFNNTANFGGMPYIPAKSPFNGSFL